MTRNPQPKSKTLLLRLTLALFLILNLNGCTPKPIQEVAEETEDRTWTNTHPYYAKGKVFDLVESELIDAYMDVRYVFWVEDEKALALLLVLFYERDAYEIYYESPHQLDLDQVVYYVSALSHENIWWEDYIVNLPTNDSVEEVVYNAVFVYDTKLDPAVEIAINKWTRPYKDAEMTQIQNARSLYDDLLDFVEYDYEAVEVEVRDTTDFYAYGALIEGSAVCSGYAEAYQGLLKEMDIPALIIVSDTDDHAWNMIYLEGTWTFVDTTFGDTDGYSGDYYFMLDKETLELDHNFDKGEGLSISYEEYMELAYYVFGS